MSKLVLVGPLPPAYHGQSVSFKMLADSLAITTPVEVINIADKNLTGKSGTLFLLARILQYILIICNFIRVLSKGPCRVYITIAQSRSGFIRDF
ncbi:hypothetical protein [Vibrio bathopelagicus]|uniref:hypothetical protein n=1 Tax=Vibrio bathopelagicus TaxID=2777577 RepID=UPI0018647746|nr:hypothetical protein [Vibrio bathopelagicus]